MLHQSFVPLIILSSVFLSTVGEIYVHKGYCMIEMAMFYDFMQPLISLKIFFSNLNFFLGFDLTENIVAAFRGMHVSPAKDSYAWLPLESVTTGQKNRRTDIQTPDKVIPMCRYASHRHDFAKWWKKLKLRMCQLGRGSGGRLGPQKLWGKWCKILHSRHFQALKITYGKHDFLYQIITLWNNYYLTQQ